VASKALVTEFALRTFIRAGVEDGKLWEDMKLLPEVPRLRDDTFDAELAALTAFLNPILAKVWSNDPVVNHSRITTNSVFWTSLGLLYRDLRWEKPNSRDIASRNVAGPDLAYTNPRILALKLASHRGSRAYITGMHAWFCEASGVFGNPKV
jgi:hypothetical protein